MTTFLRPGRGERARGAPPIPTPASPRSRARSSPPPWPGPWCGLERKGRGGKEVTVVEKGSSSSARQRAAGTLGQVPPEQGDLGCGGVVEARTIVLQGDQRGRAVTWLEAKGVRKVTRG